MTAADVLLTILALGVALLLARGSHLAVSALLVASALAVSAALFLPTAMLRDWLGTERVHLLHRLASASPLDLSDWIHLAAFAWLGLLAWLAREDVRNGYRVLLVGGLGVAAEASQLLADGREPKWEDAALNVVGGVAGVVLAHVCCMVASRLGRRGAHDRREAN